MKAAVILCSLLLFSQSALATGEQGSPDQAPVIVVKASRFLFAPNKITLKKGQTVILEIEATDRLHGFSIPELDVRSDVAPGQKVSVKITPDKIGRFTFFCDIFCGSGHEEMSGVIIVEN
jgi:cytochrome c oxidase subunit II